MRAQVVVVVLPETAMLAHLLQGSEEVAVEQLAAKRTVEALDVGVLGGAGGLNPVQGGALATAPVLQGLADELGPVVHAQALGRAVALGQCLQQTHDAGGGQGEIHLQPQHLAVPILDDIERAEAPSISQRVAHEIHRPALVGPFGHLQRLLDPVGQAPFFPAPV